MAITTTRNFGSLIADTVATKVKVVWLATQHVSGCFAAHIANTLFIPHSCEYLVALMAFNRFLLIYELLSLLILEIFVFQAYLGKNLTHHQRVLIGFFLSLEFLKGQLGG